MEEMYTLAMSSSTSPEEQLLGTPKPPPKDFHVCCKPNLQIRGQADIRMRTELKRTDHP